MRVENVWASRRNEKRFIRANYAIRSHRPRNTTAIENPAVSALTILNICPRGWILCQFLFRNHVNLTNFKLTQNPSRIPFTAVLRVDSTLGIIWHLAYCNTVHSMISLKQHVPCKLDRNVYKFHLRGHLCITCRMDFVSISFSKPR